MQLWGGRFSGTTDERVAEFTRSVELDRALALDDLAGSIAHVRGLGRAGLLAADEVTALVAGLEGLRAEVEADAVAWDPALEDVHMNLEAALAARIGPLAGKLHTGRSRNDQVATDLRLWLRRSLDRLDAGAIELERALVGLAEREGSAVLPGTTHIQPAQPVLFAHHLLAYVEMLEREHDRRMDAQIASTTQMGDDLAAELERFLRDQRPDADERRGEPRPRVDRFRPPARLRHPARADEASRLAPRVFSTHQSLMPTAHH